MTSAVADSDSSDEDIIRGDADPDECVSESEAVEEGPADQVVDIDISIATLMQGFSVRTWVVSLPSCTCADPVLLAWTNARKDCQFCTAVHLEDLSLLP